LVKAIAQGQSLEKKFVQNPNDFREKIRTIIHGLNAIVGTMPHPPPQPHTVPQQHPTSQPHQPPQHQTSQPHPTAQSQAYAMVRPPKEIPIPQTKSEMFELLHRQFRRPFTPLEFDNNKMQIEDDPKKRFKANPRFVFDEKNMLESQKN